MVQVNFVLSLQIGRQDYAKEIRTSPERSTVTGYRLLTSFYIDTLQFCFAKMILIDRPKTLDFVGKPFIPKFSSFDLILTVTLLARKKNYYPNFFMCKETI